MWRSHTGNSDPLSPIVGVVLITAMVLGFVGLKIGSRQQAGELGIKSAAMIIGVIGITVTSMAFFNVSGAIILAGVCGFNFLSAGLIRAHLSWGGDGLSSKGGGYRRLENVVNLSAGALIATLSHGLLIPFIDLSAIGWIQCGVLVFFVLVHFMIPGGAGESAEQPGDATPESISARRYYLTVALGGIMGVIVLKTGLWYLGQISSLQAFSGSIHHSAWLLTLFLGLALYRLICKSTSSMPGWVFNFLVISLSFALAISVLVFKSIHIVGAAGTLLAGDADWSPMLFEFLTAFICFAPAGIGLGIFTGWLVGSGAGEKFPSGWGLACLVLSAFLANLGLHHFIIPMVGVSWCVAAFPQIAIAVVPSVTRTWVVSAVAVTGFSLIFLIEMSPFYQRGGEELKPVHIESVRGLVTTYPGNASHGTVFNSSIRLDHPWDDYKKHFTKVWAEESGAVLSLPSEYPFNRENIPSMAATGQGGALFDRIIVDIQVPRNNHWRYLVTKRAIEGYAARLSGDGWLILYWPLGEVDLGTTSSLANHLLNNFNSVQSILINDDVTYPVIGFVCGKSESTGPSLEQIALRLQEQHSGSGEAVNYLDLMDGYLGNSDWLKERVGDASNSNDYVAVHTLKPLPRKYELLDWIMTGWQPAWNAEPHQFTPMKSSDNQLTARWFIRRDAFYAFVAAHRYLNQMEYSLAAEAFIVSLQHDPNFFPPVNGLRKIAELVDLSNEALHALIMEFLNLKADDFQNDIVVDDDKIEE